MKEWLLKQDHIHLEHAPRKLAQQAYTQYAKRRLKNTLRILCYCKKHY
jgi:hypothetical protein